MQRHRASCQAEQSCSASSPTPLHSEQRRQRPMWFHSSVNEPGGQGEHWLGRLEEQLALRYVPGGQLEHCSRSPVALSRDQ